MERCAARQGAQQGGADTEDGSPKGTQVPGRPAPPPRRVGRPVLGRSADPSGPRSATPPPRDPGQDDECTTPRRAGARTVESLTLENQRLRDALAVAELQLRELAVLLAAAAAQTQGSPSAAGHAAAEGGQAAAGQPSGGRSRRRRRKRQKKSEQPAGGAEAGELQVRRVVEEDEREEGSREEKEEQAGAEVEADDGEKEGEKKEEQEQGPAGGDPAPEQEQGQEEEKEDEEEELPQQQQQQQQEGARPPTPWADQCDYQLDVDAMPRSPAVDAGAGRPGAAPPCWLCPRCGLANAAWSALCGNPRCGAPCAPQAGGPSGEGPCQQELGADATFPLPCIAQPAVAGAPCSGAAYQYAPPPPRHAPPLQGAVPRVYATPVEDLLLVPVGPPRPPPPPVSAPPPPVPVDPRYLMGEALYTGVAALCPQRAAQLTGMLLELDSSTINHLLTDPEQLAREVWEAWEALAAAERPQLPQQPPPPPPPGPAAAVRPCHRTQGRYVPPFRRRLQEA